MLLRRRSFLRADDGHVRADDNVQLFVQQFRRRRELLHVLLRLRVRQLQRRSVVGGGRVTGLLPGELCAALLNPAPGRGPVRVRLRRVHR